MYSASIHQSSNSIKDFSAIWLYGARMELSERIREARKAANLSQAALAEKVGVTRAAVALWESGSSVPKRDVFEKIAEATQKDVLWLERGVTPGRKVDRSLSVIGEVAGGLWREGTVEFKPVKMPVSPVPDYPASSQRLYVVRGDSVNKIVADGEYVHCVSVAESGISPQPGDLVIVRRMQHEMAEYTAKRLVNSNTGWILRPESTDPMWQSDLVIDGDDSTSIEITDVIIAKWSPLRRL